MQVNDKRLKDNTTFESVGIGEVFSWGGELYMRTRLCKSNPMMVFAITLSH